MTERLSSVSRNLAASGTVLALLAVVASGCGSSGGGSTSSTSAAAASASTLAPVHGAYSPSIDPANFGSVIDNRYWPLKAGTGYHYKGVRGTTRQTDDEIVTHQTKQILGIACPNMVYPYLRAIVSDVCTRAGFPPVVLSEVNFQAMYEAQQAQALAQGNATNGSGAVGAAG